MSECSEHRGKYLHEAACLKCLSLYWEMQYKAQRTKVAELEAENAILSRYTGSLTEAMQRVEAAEAVLEGVRKWINEERDSEHKRQCHAVVCENCARIICADELQTILNKEQGGNE